MSKKKKTRPNQLNKKALVQTVSYNFLNFVLWVFIILSSLINVDIKILFFPIKIIFFRRQ